MLLFHEDWKILTVRGICAVLFGMITLLNPELTLQSLMFLFAFYVLMDSTWAYVGSRDAANASAHHRPIWIAIVIGVGAGLLSIIFAAVAAIVLLYFFAALAVITGGMALRASLEIRSDGFRDWLVPMRCMALIVFGVLLALYPLASITAIVMLIGLFALIQGVLQLGTAYRLYQWHSGHGALGAG
jgi:uncharacterized membrane protein HdeD (DUF308 family)